MTYLALTLLAQSLDHLFHLPLGLPHVTLSHLSRPRPPLGRLQDQALRLQLEFCLRGGAGGGGAAVLLGGQCGGLGSALSISLGVLWLDSNGGGVAIGDCTIKRRGALQMYC